MFEWAQERRGYYVSLRVFGNSRIFVFHGQTSKGPRTSVFIIALKTDNVYAPMLVNHSQGVLSVLQAYFFFRVSCITGCPLTHYVAKNDLDLVTSHPHTPLLPLKFWDYR